MDFALMWILQDGEVNTGTWQLGKCMIGTYMIKKAIKGLYCFFLTVSFRIKIIALYGRCQILSENTDDTDT